MSMAKVIWWTIEVNGWANWMTDQKNGNLQPVWWTRVVFDEWEEAEGWLAREVKLSDFIFWEHFLEYFLVKLGDFIFWEYLLSGPTLLSTI